MKSCLNNAFRDVPPSSPPIPGDNLQSPPPTVLLPECRGLADLDRVFLGSVILACGELPSHYPDGSWEPNAASVFRALLSENTLGAAAGATLKGGLPGVGGFTLISGGGGFALDLVVFHTDAHGYRHFLGQGGTVLQCYHDAVAQKHPAHYQEALEVIRMVVAKGTCVSMCSQDCRATRKSRKPLDAAIKPSLTGGAR